MVDVFGRHDTISTSGQSYSKAGDTVHALRGTVTIPSSCWFDRHSQSTTELQFQSVTGTRPIFRVFDTDGIKCLADRKKQGGSPIVAGMDCALRTSGGSVVTSLYLHAPQS